MNHTAAKRMTVSSLNKLFVKETLHPMVDKLIFLEVNTREDDVVDYRIFPAYLAKPVFDKDEKLIALDMDIMQRVGHQNALLRARIPIKGMYKSWQIWSSIPSEADLKRYRFKHRLPARKAEAYPDVEEKTEETEETKAAVDDKKGEA